MFLSRKGLWFPFSILLIYSCVGSVLSTKQDDDTIGNAFGSLFKAILHVVKSQFETTKDFVPGLDTTGGEASTNDTIQIAGVNGSNEEDNSDVKMDMKVDLKSKKVFVNDESFVRGTTSIPSVNGDISSTSETEDSGTFTEDSFESASHKPGPEDQGQSVSENGDGDQISVQEHRGQSSPEELNPDQASNQRPGTNMANQADTNVQMTPQECQSSDTEEALGKSKLPVVSFSNSKAISPKENLQGISEVPGADTWPFEPDVKEMLGVLEQEVTEPVDAFNSKSNGGDEELDKAGYVHAENMTEVEVSTIEASDHQTPSPNDDTTPNADVQNQSREKEKEMPNHDETVTGLSETLSNSIENPETNDTDTTGLNSGDNMSPSEVDSIQTFGGANGGKALSESLQGLPVPKEDGENIWPFQQDVGGMVHTVEKELDQHGISPSGHVGQGPSQGNEELNNDIKIEQSNMRDKDENIKADNVETRLSDDESVDQKKSHNPGGTGDTKASDESSTLLRLVNTI